MTSDDRRGVLRGGKLFAGLYVMILYQFSGSVVSDADDNRIMRHNRQPVNLSEDGQATQILPDQLRIIIQVAEDLNICA